MEHHGLQGQRQLHPPLGVPVPRREDQLPLINRRQLAGMLPQIVDKLTPHGQLPEGDLLAQGLAILKGKVGIT